MTIINKKRLEDLLRTEKKLQALENGGVDNWEWYWESLKEFNKQEEDLLSDIEQIFGENAYEPSGAEIAFSYEIQGQLLNLFKTNNLTFKEPEWYKKVPFEKTLCWVSDYVEKPAEGDKLRPIKGYAKGSSYPFCLGKNAGYKYATPLTKKEMIKLILEVQENE